MGVWGKGVMLRVSWRKGWQAQKDGRPESGTGCYTPGRRREWLEGHRAAAAGLPQKSVLGGA